MIPVRIGMLMETPPNAEAVRIPRTAGMITKSTVVSTLPLATRFSKMPEIPVAFITLPIRNAP